MGRLAEEESEKVEMDKRGRGNKKDDDHIRKVGEEKGMKRKGKGKREMLRPEL